MENDQGRGGMNKGRETNGRRRKKGGRGKRKENKDKRSAIWLPSIYLEDLSSDPPLPTHTYPSHTQTLTRPQIINRLSNTCMHARTALTHDRIHTRIHSHTYRQ